MARPVSVDSCRHPKSSMPDARPRSSPRRPSSSARPADRSSRTSAARRHGPAPPATRRPCGRRLRTASGTRSAARGPVRRRRRARRPRPPSGASRFTPTPTTTERRTPSLIPVSTRIPPTLLVVQQDVVRPLARHAATGDIADRLAPSHAPASSDSRPARAGGSEGRSTTENSSASSGTSAQVLSSRPRPVGLVRGGHEGPFGRSCVRHGDCAVALVERVTSSARTGAVDA